MKINEMDKKTERLKINNNIKTKIALSDYGRNKINSKNQ